METNENQEGLHQSEDIHSIDQLSNKSSEFNEQPGLSGQNRTVELKEFQDRPIRYAGFWMRFWAYLLDLIVVGSIVRLLIKPVFRLLDVSLVDFNIFAPISIASAVIFYLYFVFMTKYLNQTLGKMVFGLKVVDLKKDKLSWSTILFREWIGRFISATVIVGYLVVAFLPKKQGLHDLFTDTTVIHVER